MSTEHNNTYLNKLYYKNNTSSDVSYNISINSLILVAP